MIYSIFWLSGIITYKIIFDSFIVNVNKKIATMCLEILLFQVSNANILKSSFLLMFYNC